MLKLFFNIKQLTKDITGIISGEFKKLFLI